MTTYNADVAVIGAGTAGLAAEHHAREGGATTLLIDPAFAGTTCATVGCMPSKLLIAAADAAHGAREARDLGVMTEPRVDGRAVLERVRRLRDDFVRGVRQSIDALPEGTCLKACARFEAPGVLVLDTGDRVEARAVVIATGAGPALPEPYEAVKDHLLTNETIFELEDLPESLGVIGAGPLGLELAQAMHRLGVRVKVFDAGDRLAGLPPRASEALHGVLTKAFPIHLGCKPEPLARDAGVALTWEGGEARFDKLLVAAGRPPNLSGLDLEKAGLELDEHGTPRFDPGTMQCGDVPVFIAGDANHDRPVLHEASDEGTVAGRNAAAWPDLRRTARKVPLSIAFTRPEAAVIGAVQDGPGYVCGEADYGDQGRAKVEGRVQGLAYIYARASDGRLVGAALCAPGGEHLAHLLAWAIQCEMTASDMLDLPFYHPVLEEGLKTALRDVCRQAGLARPWQRNDDSLPGSDGGVPEG
ncbi:dihydrolipoyl dehydrogenase [Roseovarius pacificus]|uniref:dihydrolipoyl dehydrogenase n=1 Tax=Roseovarius pacificus TaxID=337701 RepID=UPI002A1898D9|nr:dihydrolipoyl dehydrogenase [Roseovarius pacificus]